MLIKADSNKYVNSERMLWVKVSGSTVTIDDAATRAFPSAADALAFAESITGTPDWVKCQSSNDWLKKDRIRRVGWDGSNNVSAELEGYSLALPGLASGITTSSAFEEYVEDLFVD